MKKYMTYCGLYCGACGSMIAFETTNAETSEQNADDAEAGYPCPGCGSPEQQNCEFVQCNKNHGTECCAFCPEFPCAMIKAFKDEEWIHHNVVIDNLFRIREIGVDAWLIEQKILWQCRVCGARTQWYQTECPDCGATWEQRFPSL